MTLRIEQWHQRYMQQASWTKNLRHYIYEKVNISRSKRILDIGCGTGILENELNSLYCTKAFGLDIQRSPVILAKGYAPNSLFMVGDGLSLPFITGTFDVTFCHFLLLWLDKPSVALTEMTRVTIPGGTVMALAEPDYGGRIDYPPELTQIGTWQTQALKDQGANPFIGREVRKLFTEAGLKNVEAGVLGGEWKDEFHAGDFEMEWTVIQSDLHDNEQFLAQQSEYRKIELDAHRLYKHILFVPTFYAMGVVEG